MFQDWWMDVLIISAVLTIAIGNLLHYGSKHEEIFGLFIHRPSRLYSFRFMGSSAMGMASVVYFLFIYIFSNLAAFGVVQVYLRYGERKH